MPYQRSGNGSHGPGRYAGAPMPVPPQQLPLFPPSYRLLAPPQTNPLALIALTVLAADFSSLPSQP